MSVPLVADIEYLTCVLLLCRYRRSYLSAPDLLNLFNKLGKRDKMRGLPSIVSLFRNKFNKFNYTRARRATRDYSSYDIQTNLKSHFCCKNVRILALCMQRCYERHNFSRNL